MYAKQSYQLLVRGVVDTDVHLSHRGKLFDEGAIWKMVVEKTPRTEFCAQKGNLSVKCKQEDNRPFGEFAPLSDAAPINIQIGEGRVSIGMTKTTSDCFGNLASPVSESTACYQSNWWNLGDPTESVCRRIVRGWQDLTIKFSLTLFWKSELSIVSEKQSNVCGEKG